MQRFSFSLPLPFLPTSYPSFQFLPRSSKVDVFLCEINCCIATGFMASEQDLWVTSASFQIRTALPSQGDPWGWTHLPLPTGVRPPSSQALNTELHSGLEHKGDALSSYLVLQLLVRAGAAYGVHRIRFHCRHQLDIPFRRRACSEVCMKM